MPECLKTRVKHGIGGIMVWGTFLFSGVGELIQCDKHNINANESINILERGLLPTAIDKLLNQMEHIKTPPPYTDKLTTKKKIIISDVLVQTKFRFKSS